jgi:hypothetical protein
MDHDTRVDTIRDAIEAYLDDLTEIDTDCLADSIATQLERKEQQS